jgi:hypothetical protein
MSSIQVTQIRAEKDLDKVHELVRRLIGETCWDADAPQESLFLYLGEKRRIHDAIIGAWQLRTLASPWDLMDGDSTLARAEDLDSRESIADAVAILVGTTVTDVVIKYPSLGATVVFDDHLSLRIDLSRNSEGGDEEDPERGTVYEVGYWEIVTADNMFVEMGPGPYWRYGRADVAR